VICELWHFVTQNCCLAWKTRCSPTRRTHERRIPASKTAGAEILEPKTKPDLKKDSKMTKFKQLKHGYAMLCGSCWACSLWWSLNVIETFNFFSHFFIFLRSISFSLQLGMCSILQWRSLPGFMQGNFDAWGSRSKFPCWGWGHLRTWVHTVQIFLDTILPIRVLTPLYTTCGCCMLLSTLAHRIDNCKRQWQCRLDGSFLNLPVAFLSAASSKFFSTLVTMPGCCLFDSKHPRWHECKNSLLQLTFH